MTYSKGEIKANLKWDIDEHFDGKVSKEEFVKNVKKAAKKAFEAAYSDATAKRDKTATEKALKEHIPVLKTVLLKQELTHHIDALVSFAEKVEMTSSFLENANRARGGGMKVDNIREKTVDDMERQMKEKIQQLEGIIRNNETGVPLRQL